MSERDTKKPGAIKIAAKDASQRNSGNGSADPGPGDINAAPSVDPQVVELPEPPTPSQLVVKSKNDSQPLPTMKESSRSIGNQSGSVPASKLPSGGGTGTGSQSASRAALSGSQAGPAASNPSQASAVSRHSRSGATGSARPDGSAPRSAGQVSQATSPTASVAMQADSGALRDEVEEGEGEVEQSPSPSPGPSGTVPGESQATGEPSPAVSEQSDSRSPAPQMDQAPPSTGVSKASTKTSTHRHQSHKSSAKKGKPKITKFRYHKRVTVRTSGKTSPTAIMDKVSKKDHKAGITPSAIEEMDPQELMKRAGIKGNKQSHWRVRLRQTRRLTKDGKTTTVTRVAYRDSEGNKRIRTSSTPYCKKCKEKLELCKCDPIPEDD